MGETLVLPEGTDTLPTPLSIVALVGLAVVVQLKVEASMRLMELGDAVRVQVGLLSVVTVRLPQEPVGPPQLLITVTVMV